MHLHIFTARRRPNKTRSVALVALLALLVLSGIDAIVTKPQQQRSDDSSSNIVNISAPSSSPSSSNQQAQLQQQQPSQQYQNAYNINAYGEHTLPQQQNGECGAHQACQNGGTCVEGPHNYSCVCPDRFTGPYCERDINECATRPSVCKNGATCNNKVGGYQCVCVNGWTGPDCSENVDDCSAAACQSGATCHDRVGHFYCECPPGKTGLFCQLDDGCARNPCHHNATCDTSPIDGSATCTCPSGFTGPHCSIDIDECDGGSPCEHGGSCVNTPGSYRCECPKGFTGSRCEININECEVNPCQNEGTCLDEKGGFKCICMRGFTGQRCEIDIDECAQNPCQNGAVCKDGVNSFRCSCQKGFWGERCEFSVRNQCEIRGCEAKRQNGKCDQECNSLSCAFDGGDCLLGEGNPWAKCPNPYACWTAFKDGKCDQDCNIAECLYDGNDCIHDSFNRQHRPDPTTGGPVVPTRNCDEKSDSYCLKNYANGVCDMECNSAECGWDGADCEMPRNDLLSGASTEAQGLLVIRVEPALDIGSGSGSRQDIELARLLRKVAIMTKAILKIQNFRQVEEGRGTEIELIADNRRCQTSCYNSTELIAKFLSALKSHNSNDFERSITPGALKMTEIRSQIAPELSDPAQRSASTVFFISFGFMIPACAMVIMVISRGNNKQKKVERAITWFPEGFKTGLSSRKQDPTDRRPGRGVSTLQALSGNFFRGLKRNERNIANEHDSRCQSTDVDRCNGAATPNGGGIYHEPYDQYGGNTLVNGYDGATYIGTTYNGAMDGAHVVEPMTPTPLPVNPVNIEGPHGLTPLMVAAMGPPLSKDPLGLVAYGTTGEVITGAGSNVTDLLHRGAQLKSTCTNGETALHIAARYGRVDSARGILERCDVNDVNAQDNSGRTPLHSAIAGNATGVFELLIRCRHTNINKQMYDGTTPLILATRHGLYSMVEELILNECDVTKGDASGKTALHWAAATNNVDIIRRLLAVRETNKDAQDIAEETPLFLAAREGAKAAVEIMLAHNANRDISDQMDRSPTDIARSRQHYDIVHLLERCEPPTPRSITSLHGGQAGSSRQLSPFSPLSTDSNSNSLASGHHPSHQQPPAYVRMPMMALLSK